MFARSIFTSRPMLTHASVRLRALLVAGHRPVSTDPTRRADLESLFLDRRVRYLLRHLTSYDPIKVFTRKSLDNLQSPKYRFMTDEQLQEEYNKAEVKAIELLQMPPVKYAQEIKPEVLEEDAELKGFLDPSLKLVFLDATPGFDDNERMIVVREADGLLREADREERHRTNQIFYPVEERHMDMPPMFQEEHLTEMLNRGAYKLLLDNLCLHFEPIDQRYIDISAQVYAHIAQKQTFDSLLSTRHYGPMVYHYVFYRHADSLLLHLLHESRLDQVHALLRLFYLVNPRSEVPSKVVDRFDAKQLAMNIVQVEQSKPQSIPPNVEKEAIELLKIYIDHDASSLNLKPRLQLIWQKLMDGDQTQKNAASN